LNQRPLGYECARAMSVTPLISREKHVTAMGSTLSLDTSFSFLLGRVSGCCGSKMGADNTRSVPQRDLAYGRVSWPRELPVFPGLGSGLSGVGLHLGVGRSVRGGATGSEPVFQPRSRFRQESRKLTPHVYTRKTMRLKHVALGRRWFKSRRDERVPKQGVRLGQGSSIRLCSLYRRDLARERSKRK
jgi:hypothetical protein